MFNNRRDKFEIMKDIVGICKDGSKKTEILYQGNLSYALLEKYLFFLREKNILEKVESKNNGKSTRLYKSTEKGLNFLNDVNRVLMHLES